MIHPGTASFALASSKTPAHAPGLRLPRYAPTIQRFAGFLCDLAILAVVWAAASALFYKLLPESLAWLATALFVLPYAIGFVAAGVTPGSWVVGTRIVERYGRSPGLWRSLKKSLVPPLIWLIAVLAITDDNPPVRQVNYYMETHPDLFGALWGGLFLLTLVTAVFDLIKGQPARSRFPWHDDVSGTYVIRVPTRFWSAVRLALLESKDWLQTTPPWVWNERAVLRRRAAMQKLLAAQAEQRAIEERKRAIARERKSWADIYSWLDMRSEAEQDSILEWLTERRKRRF